MGLETIDRWLKHRAVHGHDATVEYLADSVRITWRYSFAETPNTVEAPTLEEAFEEALKVHDAATWKLLVEIRGPAEDRRLEAALKWSEENEARLAEEEEKKEGEGSEFRKALEEAAKESLKAGPPYSCRHPGCDRTNLKSPQARGGHESTCPFNPAFKGREFACKYQNRGCARTFNSPPHRANHERQCPFRSKRKKKKAAKKAEPKKPAPKQTATVPNGRRRRGTVLVGEGTVLVGEVEEGQIVEYDDQYLIAEPKYGMDGRNFISASGGMYLNAVERVRPANLSRKQLCLAWSISQNGLKKILKKHKVALA